MRLTTARSWSIGCMVGGRSKATSSCPGNCTQPGYTYGLSAGRSTHLVSNHRVQLRDTHRSRASVEMTPIELRSGARGAPDPRQTETSWARGMVFIVSHKTLQQASTDWLDESESDVYQGCREGGVHVPPEIPMLKKILGLLVNVLLQMLLAYQLLVDPYQGTAPGPRWWTYVPSPTVLFPYETNFWLRPWCLRFISAR